MTETSSPYVVMASSTYPPSSGPGSEVGGNGDADSVGVSIALYAIAVPVLVWICAIGICYPVIFCFYRFCLGARFGKSPASRRRARSRCARRCCGDVEAADVEDDSFSADPNGARVSRQRPASVGRRGTLGASATVGLPPAYDEALSMPKPQVGESVRFQNDVDGGWCTFTWVEDDDNDGPPPQYVAFYAELGPAAVFAVADSSIDADRNSADNSRTSVAATVDGRQNNTEREVPSFEANSVESSSSLNSSIS
jgi:hypothetical protein